MTAVHAFRCAVARVADTPARDRRLETGEGTPSLVARPEPCEDSGVKQRVTFRCGGCGKEEAREVESAPLSIVPPPKGWVWIDVVRQQAATGIAITARVFHCYTPSCQKRSAEAAYRIAERALALGAN